MLMKLLKLGLLLLLLISRFSYALNPIPGLYGGVILGASKAPDIHFNVVSPIDVLSGPGDITSSVLGNVGGQLGYRVKNLRAEAEFFYNNNPYSHLNIGGVNVPNSNSLQTSITLDPLTFEGYTNTYALMFNGFYDFYIPDYTEKWVPYVGLGVGYEHVENNIIIYISGSTAPNSAVSEYSNLFAGQAIAGLSYFLTDYTSFNVDFRYLSAFRSTAGATQQSSFQSRSQLYSVNLIFNSAFNLA